MRLSAPLQRDIQPSARWSMVMAYYNEEDYLEETLLSIMAQSLRPFELILVDNASTDRSGEIARNLTRQAVDIQVKHLHQPLPGHVYALHLGLQAVRTPYVAFCDADTFYPPDYLKHADRVFEHYGQHVVGVIATNLSAPPDELSGLMRRLHVAAASWLMPRQGHSGGNAHAFRTMPLRSAGGYDTDLWPYVLYDHEMIHRVLKHGKIIYPFGHWCIPSARRKNDPNVRWTLSTRILYHLTPFWLKDWFFYDFLAKQFKRRNMGHVNLRLRPWQKDES